MVRRGGTRRGEGLGRGRGRERKKREREEGVGEGRRRGKGRGQMGREKREKERSVADKQRERAHVGVVLDVMPVDRRCVHTSRVQRGAHFLAPHPPELPWYACHLSRSRPGAAPIRLLSSTSSAAPRGSPRHYARAPAWCVLSRG